MISHNCGMNLSLHCWPAGVRSDSESCARASGVWHEEENLPRTVEVEEKKRQELCLQQNNGAQTVEIRLQAHFVNWIYTVCRIR